LQSEPEDGAVQDGGENLHRRKQEKDASRATKHRRMHQRMRDGPNDGPVRATNHALNEDSHPSLKQDEEEEESDDELMAISDNAMRGTNAVRTLKLHAYIGSL